VREYLRLSLFDELRLSQNFRKILAITFTNRAAAEMKLRVIDALAGLCAPSPPAPLAQMLCDDLKIGKEELARRARIVLGEILHNYSDFSIGTIDSFTHRIVRTFAHDLDLPLNFNVELDIESFYGKVIASLFSSIGEDPYVSRLLREFSLHRAEENAPWDPQRQLEEFAKLLQQESSGPFIEKLKSLDAAQLEEIGNQFSEYIAHYRSTLKQLAERALKLIADAGLGDDDFIYKSGGPQTFFRKCQSGTLTLADANGARITEALRTGTWSKSPAPALRAISSELTAIGKALVQFITANHSYYALCQLLSRQMVPLMLLRKLEEIGETQKAEDHLVFISEFNQKIHRIIREEPTPFIYERLGERYQHYLLDEFQDTSSLQWMNILPLLDNSLAGGWFNLVVGDGKQSIYRWRNANVKQFAMLPALPFAGIHHAAETAATLDRNFEEKLLDVNFRSASNVVAFNNSFFGQLSSRVLSGDKKDIYKHHQQKGPQGDAGYVTVDHGAIGREALDEATLQRLLVYIEQAQADGYAPGDVCILARTNAHGHTIAGYLTKRGVAVVSSDSLLLRHNHEVNVLTCFLRHLVNPDDKVSAAAVIHHAYGSGDATDDQIHEALRRICSGESLFIVLEAIGIRMNPRDLPLLGLPGQCIAIARALRLTNSAHHYIRFYLDEVNEFATQHGSSVPGFLQWWETRSAKASLILPDSPRAVRVMTIHSSKGLEFPVVIVPYCNWKIFRPSDQWVDVRHEKVNLPVGIVKLTKQASEAGLSELHELERSEQVLDSLNLLYVAFTRAAERLHVISYRSQGQENVAQWVEEYVNSAAAEAGHYETGTRVKATKKQPAGNGPDRHEMHPLMPLVLDGGSPRVKVRSSWRLDADDSDPIAQGILMHELLSRVTDTDSIDTVLKDAVTEGLLTVSQVPGIRHKLRTVSEHELLRACFRKGARHKQEAAICLADGTLLRPDRVVFEDSVTWLVDYKTGREYARRHATQLEKYAVALQSMGFPNIRKLLVYLDAPLVVEVN
jgi:ATP-dependent exoDNAse (exonuclease V) beta subunit